MENQLEGPVMEAMTSSTGDVEGKLIVSLQGDDFIMDFERLGLSMESSNEDVMNKVSPIIEEQFDVDIRNTYKIQKALNSNNIHVIPSSVAGK